jgi:outer membrane assembly lipoprotein YfiO
MKIKKVFTFFLLLALPCVSSQAYWVWSPEAGKFVNAEGAAQDSAEEQFDYAMKLYREKNLDEASDKFKEILEKYPQSRVAPEALYRLGLIQEETGDYLKAFKTYKKLVESYPQSERFNEVIEREFRIGNVFLSGKKAKIAGFEILASLPRAVDVFQHVVKFAPYSEFGDKAQFHLGLAFKKWRHYGEAVEAFQELIDKYPQSEFASQARYELAETSFMRSVYNSRDQRALDDASKQVGRFLDRYPDASTAEKAETIKQQIDEKNAEKNYRVGLYYEKDNYIESALIYYEDVAKRYPGTQWGQKAAEKMKTLKEPAKYLNEQKTVLEEQEQALRHKLQTLEEQKKDDVEIDITKRSLERLEKRQKTLSKDKKETLERRKDDIARRERELKEKFKNLEQKRKLLKKNPSEDLKRAIDRWHASLINEQEALGMERKQVEGWREELGMPDSRFDMDFLPFVGEEPNEVEKIRRIEAKKFYKLSEEKRALLEEKETLYKHHSEVSSMLRRFEGGASLEGLSEEQVARLKPVVEEIDRLESEIKDKSTQYERHYGESMLTSVKDGLRKSIDRSLDMVNPFDDKKADPTDAQRLLERQMHLKERIATQQALVETLNQAFDSQIELQEKKRLLAQMDQKEKADPKVLRKSIRDLERQIRGGYEEIEARHTHKKKLVKELDAVLKQREKEDPLFTKAARTAAAPATGTVKFFRAFLFGMPVKDAEVTKAASKIQDGPNTGAIKNLEEEIRGESLIIDAKNREILNLRKELEILRAQASLAGGYKFRSVFVNIPYLFFNEAMESARKVIPKKEREELLITRIDKETKKHETLKKDLKTLDGQISGLEPEARAEAQKSLPPALEVTVESKVPSSEELKTEIENLQKKLEAQQVVYRQEQASNKAAAQEAKDLSKAQSKDRKQTKKLSKELEEIEESLGDLIRKENDLEKEETTILEKRIQHIDRTMKKINSKAVSQDLLTEKERMEERLTQLESRKNFLSKELERFQFAAEAATTTRS